MGDNLHDAQTLRFAVNFLGFKRHDQLQIFVVE